VSQLPRSHETRMSIEWPTVVEGGIPIVGGLYATALGYGLIGASASPPSAFKQNLLARFKWLGPAVVRAGYTVQARYSFKGSPEEILISLPPWSCGN
jgi:hypothetical protein